MSTEIVPMPTDDRMPTNYDPEQAKAMSPLNWTDVNTKHNFDLADEEQSEKFLTALTGDDIRLEDVKGSTFPTVHYLAHVVTFFSDADGEYLTRARVVLMGPDGKRLAWTSPSATKCWGAIMYVKGNGPWTEPLPVRVIAHKGKKAGYFYQLDLVPGAKGGKKGK